MSTHFAELQSSQLPPPLPYTYGELIIRPDAPVKAGYVAVPQLLTATLKYAALLRLTATRHEAPRLLVVVGPPGTGKSQGVLHALTSAHYHVAVVPPNLFAAETENGATVVLDSFMAEMARYSHERQALVAVVIEDVDTSILARDDKTSVTPNHRMLAGRLQFIADHRELYTNYDGSAIGLVLTANRPDELRSSLIRSMRAQFVEHNPSPAETFDIVFQMFDPRSADERRFLERLFDRYRRENLSFWRALKQNVDAAQLDELLSEGMPDLAILDAAMKRRRPLDPKIVWPLAEASSASRSRNFFAR